VNSCRTTPADRGADKRSTATAEDFARARTQIESSARLQSYNRQQLTEASRCTGQQIDRLTDGLFQGYSAAIPKTP
jgi:hypothetical protein